MKAILIGGLVLMMAWLSGTEPAAAVPLRLAAPPAPEVSPPLIPARHHHHHRHWRHGYSRGFDYDAPDPDTPAAEGQTTPLPASPETQAGTAPPPTDRGSRSGTAARPSIRWVNPDRPTR